MLSVNEINLLQAQNEGLKKQNAELQKENAELKAENERLSKNAEDTYDLYKALMKSFEISNNERSKYKQTLQEIKEIIHEQLMWQGQLPQCELEILQKITKAESEVE